MYKRKCPVCNADICYTRKYHMKKAEENKCSCRKCSNKVPWNKGLKGVQEPWNKGLKGVQISDKKGKKFEEIYGAEKSRKIKDKLKKSLTGRKLSDEHKKNISLSEKDRNITWGHKISEAMLGRELSKEHIQKLKDNHVGMTGKKHSIETLIKMRLSRIKEIESKYGTVYPNYNKNGCETFNKIMLKNNCNIQHAENGGEYKIENLGYWVDGYDIENNVVYEFDESHHYDFNGNLKEKDIIRQNQIENFLKCKVIRIKEN